MRLFDAFLYLILGATFSCGGGHADLQCEQSSNCDLATGGLCLNPGTGNHWCAYPDTSCASGFRYSDVQVGDGVSGMCVPADSDGGVAMPFPSCLALPQTCGGANGTDDCCNSPTVPGGTYYRSYDVGQDGISGDMSAPATISTFRLDKYEVTVGRFRAFVEAGQGTQSSPPATGSGAHPKIPGSGWQAAWTTNLAPDKNALISALTCNANYATWTNAPGLNENRPMTCLTWYEALAFCSWDGGYLPTEAEWNYAAAGGDQQRAFPWSNPPGNLTIDSTRANYNGSCDNDGKAGCQATDWLYVGSKPAGDGRWGQSDLGGNDIEWTLDLYAPYVNPCTDCAYLNPTPNMYRVFRG